MNQPITLTQSQAMQMFGGGGRSPYGGYPMPVYGYPAMQPPFVYGVQPGYYPPQAQPQAGGGALQGIGALGGLWASNQLFGGGKDAAAAGGKGLLSSGPSAASSLAGPSQGGGIFGGIGDMSGLAGSAAETESAALGGPGFSYGGAQAATGGSWLPSFGGIGTLPALGIGAAALGAGILAARGGSEAVKGKPISPVNQIGLAPLTGGLSLAQPMLSRTFGSRKGKDQLARDQVRKGLLASGFIDNNYGVKLADGSTFNIGKDGGEPLYNFDTSRAGAQGALDDVNPLAAILTGGNRKLNSDFAGYFTNAALSGGDARKNALQFYQNAGLNHDQAYGQIVNMVNQGQLDAATGDAYRNALDKTFGVGAYANGRDPTAQPQRQQPPARNQGRPVTPLRK